MRLTELLWPVLGFQLHGQTGVAGGFRIVRQEAPELSEKA